MMAGRRVLRAGDEETASDQVIVYYDGDCPFCSSYADLLRIRQETGLSVELRNAREWPEEVGILRRRGYDMDAGMLVVHGTAVYLGHDALHRVATMSPTFRRVRDLMDFPFRWNLLGRLAYPFARGARRIALLFRGRDAHVPGGPGHTED